MQANADFTLPPPKGQPNQTATSPQAVKSTKLQPNNPKANGGKSHQLTTFISNLTVVNDPHH